jgi:hypothetical protein
LKQKLLSALSIIMICFLVVSCTKDAPIYPDDPDFIPYPGKPGGNNGGGGSGGTVDETQISGNWEVTKMTLESYLNGALSSSIDAPINMFNSVQLSDAGKTYEFDGFSVPVPDTYTLSKTGSQLYIQFKEDPFFARTANEKIQITNLTATSMTWLALDPAITSDTPIGKATGGWKAVFKRVP